MEKIIKIGDKEVRLNNNVAWTMEYRDQFGEDIIPVIIPALATVAEMLAGVMAGVYDDAEVANDGTVEISKSDIAEAIRGNALDMLLPMYQFKFVDSIVNVTWAMAKAADENIKPPKQWVREFDEFPLDVIVPALYELVKKGFSSSKNWKRLENMIDEIKALQPKKNQSHSTTSSSQESSED